MKGQGLREKPESLGRGGWSLKPTGLRSLLRRGSDNNCSFIDQTNLVVTHKKVKKHLQVPLGPPKKYLGNFQPEDEGLYVAAGDAVLGKSGKPCDRKRPSRVTSRPSGCSKGEPLRYFYLIRRPE